MPNHQNRFCDPDRRNTALLRSDDRSISQLRAPCHIGARKQCEQRLRESEHSLCQLIETVTMQAERARATPAVTMGNLAASIAHEIKNPLASILTNGQTLVRWLARPEPNIRKAAELAERVVADARRASEIIDSIRATASGRAPRMTLLSLDDLIEETLEFLRCEWQSTGIFVSSDLAQPLPLVIGDRIQLQQVIVNLAYNAVEASMQSTVRHPSILIRTVPVDAQRVRCSIEDSGPGIAPEHLPHLFDSSFTTKDTGMGMGLSISQSIIEAHGGELRADNCSTLGGARFSFFLRVKGADNAWLREASQRAFPPQPHQVPTWLVK